VPVIGGQTRTPRRTRGLTNPLDDLLGVRGDALACLPNDVENRVGDQLDYDVGQSASLIAAISRPAAAPARPFFTGSLVKTRAMYERVDSVGSWGMTVSPSRGMRM